MGLMGRLRMKSGARVEAGDNLLEMKCQRFMGHRDIGVHGAWV